MKLILGITTFLLLGVVSVAYLYFSSLTGDSRSNDKTLGSIPADASVIFNFSNDNSFFEIFKDYTVFNSITGSKKKQELQWLKGLLLNNRELYSATQGQKVFLSFHPMSSDTLQYLWVMPLRESLELAEVQEALASRENKVEIIGKPGSTLLEIINTSIAKSFYIGIDRGIARGSFSKSLVAESLNKNSKKITDEYIKEINAEMPNNDDALASLYINHNAPGFLKSFFKESPAGNFGLFSSFAAYSSLHLNYKSDALMFHGISRITDRHNGYINLFLEQKPVKNTIKRIIPYNLSNAICYGLSDYNLFNRGLKRLFALRKEQSILDEQIKLITTETGISPDRDIKKLWGNEFSNIQLSTFENLAVMRISNGRQLQFFLEPLSTPHSDAIREMTYENLFYYYWGDPLKKYIKPFFTITDNLVIISNSSGTIQRFLNDYSSDRLLYNNESFIRFDQLVADESNISFLLQLKNSEHLLNSILKKEYSQTLKNESYGFKDFYGLSYQLTSNTDHFFTNFYLGYQNKTALSAGSLVYR